MFHTLLNLGYRLFTPKSPRGWLVFHQVADGKGTWIHCHGMERWGLQNIEFVDVPEDLGGFAHGIATGILDYMKNTKPIRSGENLGGAFVSKDQVAAHYATFHTIDRAGDPEHSNVLRIVDIGLGPDGGFPFKLFAAHLCAIADQHRTPARRAELFRRAIAIHPGTAAIWDGRAEYQHGENENNFAAHWGLGDALCDQGDHTEGVKHIQRAIAHCPSWALNFSKDLQGTGKEELSAQARKEPRFELWNNLSADRIQALINTYRPEGLT